MKGSFSMKASSASSARRRADRAASVWLAAAALLAGCAQLPEPPPLPESPPAFKEADGRWTAAGPAEAQARGEWWKVFGDPLLDDLVERAGRANTAVQAAAARLAQARAIVTETDADRYPQADLTAGATRQTLPPYPGFPRGAVSSLTAGGSFSYETDFFGRLSRATDAARLDADAREALLRNTQLLVQAEVAQDYFSLRALDDQRTLFRQTVEAYRDTLRLTERRFALGDVSELDLARLRAEVSATEAQAFALDRQRAQTEHAIAVLADEVPSRFAIVEREWGGELPLVPAGVPSTVLTRRPDVSAAQRGLLAAQARVGVAQTAWFPSLSLTATGGVASPDLGDLFQWSARAWSLNALFSLPIFDGGRREAEVRRTTGQFDEAAANYREQVLTAFRDVEDQLAALRLLADQARTQEEAVTAASRATALSDIRYSNGYVSQLDLLDARRVELGNRRESLNVKVLRYQATVGLIRALGGGWEAASPTPAAAQAPG